MSARSARRRRLVGSLALTALVVAGASCSSSGSTTKGASSTTAAPTAGGFDPSKFAATSAKLKGSGSTFQLNFNNAVIKTLQPVLPKISIAYAGGGSGQGKSDLADGVVNFAGTDSLIKPEDLPKFGGTVRYFPTVVAPITISYRLPGVEKLKVDGPTLAKIFTARVTDWNDPAIAAVNPGVELPSTPITVCRRSDASGTTTNFSKYMAAAGGSDWTLGSSDSLQWPAGTQGGDGNGGVAQCVKSKVGTIGYVDLSDGKSQHLAFASVKNKSGAFVQPTLEGASAAAANAEIADDLTYSPIDSAGAASYPITSPTWIIVKEKQTDRATGNAVKALLTFILTDGQDRSFTSSVNYAPLPKALATKALAQIDELQIP